MEAILDWIKGIVILFLVSNVLMYLIQGKVYEKYVHFFVQLLVIIAVITPFAKVICDKEEFLDQIEYTQFWQDMENVQKDAAKIEYTNQEYCKIQYEETVESSIGQLVENENCHAADVEAVLTDSYEIESVTVWISREETPLVSIEKVDIGEEDSQSPSADCVSLKEKLMEYYQLEEEQVTVGEVAS